MSEMCIYSVRKSDHDKKQRLATFVESINTEPVTLVYPDKSIDKR
jgi:hypothetical protein